MAHSMEESVSKEKVLKNVRNALINRVYNPYVNMDLDGPLFIKTEDQGAVKFAENLTANKGRFVYCASEEEFLQTIVLVAKQYGWKNILTHENRIAEIIEDSGMEASTEIRENENFVMASSCEALVAQHGSVLVSSGLPVSRKALSLAKTHLVFALTSQLHEEMNTALSAIKKKYGKNMPSFIAVLTGPSSDNSPVMPKIPTTTGIQDLIVFLIDSK